MEVPGCGAGRIPGASTGNGSSTCSDQKSTPSLCSVCLFPCANAPCGDRLARHTRARGARPARHSEGASAGAIVGACTERTGRARITLTIDMTPRRPGAAAPSHCRWCYVFRIVQLAPMRGLRRGLVRPECAMAPAIFETVEAEIAWRPGLLRSEGARCVGWPPAAGHVTDVRSTRGDSG
jgi:hypothetical protein